MDRKAETRSDVWVVADALKVGPLVGRGRSWADAEDAQAEGEQALRQLELERDRYRDEVAQLRTWLFTRDPDWKAKWTAAQTDTSEGLSAEDLRARRDAAIEARNSSP